MAERGERRKVPGKLTWLSDELHSECNTAVLQRARGITNQWRAKMRDLHCLNDPEADRITLSASVRGTTSPSSNYTVQATVDMGDQLLLARYCSCPIPLTTEDTATASAIVVSPMTTKSTITITTISAGNPHSVTWTTATMMPTPTKAHTASAGDPVGAPTDVPPESDPTIPACASTSPQ